MGVWERIPQPPETNGGSRAPTQTLWLFLLFFFQKSHIFKHYTLV